MYMPLLMFVIFMAVQMTLIYLGNQAASAVARETSRVARSTQDAGRAHQAGMQYAANIGDGILEGPRIAITPVGDDRVRVTVTGQAQKLSPIGVPTVEQTVEGPLEDFKRSDE